MVRLEQQAGYHQRRCDQPAKVGRATQPIHASKLPAGERHLKTLPVFPPSEEGGSLTQAGGMVGDLRSAHGEGT
jgi:hypothetical protein